jgi:hypothetical protein
MAVDEVDDANVVSSALQALYRSFVAKRCDDSDAWNLA